MNPLRASPRVLARIAEKFLAFLGIVAVLAAVPLACTAAQNDTANKTIDYTEQGVDTALAATGNGALIPAVHALAGVSKWVAGLFVVGGSVAAGGGTHLAHASRNKRRTVADAGWDANLADLANVAKQLAETSAVIAPTSPHIQAQAATVKAIADRLLAAQAPVPGPLTPPQAGV
jgi:hypothetical protein